MADQTWNDVETDIFCNKIDLWNSNATENCQMFMNIDIAPKDIQLVKVTSTKDDKQVKP